MNISHKHKTIWWAPERCGTKATAHILKHFHFEYFAKDYKPESKNNYQSHEILIPDEKYSDYQVICSIRNPYDRMLGLFLNFASLGASLVYDKYNHEQVMFNYSRFIDDLFKVKEITQKIEKPITDKKSAMNLYVSKYNFDITIPKNYIRMEHIVEDIGKIDFISQSSLWSSEYIQNYLKKNEHIKNHPFKFNSLYTFETAKKVYEYHKQYFLVLGYDPFSFTTKELSDEEKMNFIHGIL